MKISIQGWKTYVAAAVAIAAAIVMLIYGHTDSAAELFVFGLGLIGVRSAIAKLILANIQKNIQPIALVLACVALSVMMACGGLESALRVTFAGYPPVVDYLEAKGKIDAQTAGELRVDFPDAKNVAISLAEQLARIPKGAPDARAQKLHAWQSAEKQWVAIVDRGHFKLSPDVQEIVDLANSIFEEAIVAYGGTPSAGVAAEVKAGQMRSSATIESASAQRSDAEIEASLKAKLNELKKKFEPPKN